MNYDFDFSVVWRYWSAIRHGFAVTLFLTILVISAGTPLGFAYALLLRRCPRWGQALLIFVMDVVRSIPVLVLIFLSYYLLPALFPVRVPSPFVIACLSLSIYLAAFCADVIRGALAIVPGGYLDAARAVGLSRRQVFWRFELRWVVKTVLPSLALLWIGMLKNSSLASVIGVYELTHTADGIVANSFRSIETYTVVAMCYIAVVLPFSTLARRLERLSVMGGSSLDE